MTTLMELLHSKAKSLHIQLERFLDHRYRKITGLPSQKRSEITPQLFVGGQYSDTGLDRLKSQEFTAVVNMRTTTSPVLLAKVKKLGLAYLHLPTKDLHAPSLENLEEGIAFMTTQLSNGGKVYVHCRGGEGRGPTMAIAYLMSTGMTYEDAYTTVQSVRSFIRPTRVQRERLKELELKLRAAEDKNNG